MRTLGEQVKKHIKEREFGKAFETDEMIQRLRRWRTELELKKMGVMAEEYESLLSFNRNSKQNG